MCDPWCRAVHWQMSGGGNVPGNAVEAGYDETGETLYVGCAFHEGDRVPGKIVPSHGVCYIAYAGEEVGKNEYEVLINPHSAQLSWEYCSGGDIPYGAVHAGCTSDNEPLYVGRTQHEGALTVGKVHPSHGCLYIPYGGEEHSYTEYEILVCRD